MKSKSKKSALPKPRDPFVLHILKRKQGAHNLSRKAQRSRDRAALRKEF